MKLLKVLVLLLSGALLLAGVAALVGCGGDDCAHCCMCDCGSSSMSFSSQDCIDCEDACTNGLEVPIFGHMDGCGSDLVSFEEHQDRSACD